MRTIYGMPADIILSVGVTADQCSSAQLAAERFKVNFEIRVTTHTIELNVCVIFRQFL